MSLGYSNKFCLLLSVLLAATTFLSATSLLADDKVPSLQSEIVVQEDGSVLITEARTHSGEVQRDVNTVHLEGHIVYHLYHDELRWTVLENNGSQPMDNIRAAVVLPTSVPLKSVRNGRIVKTESGENRSGNTTALNVGLNRRILIDMKGPLEPGSAFVVVVTWPPGHVTDPGIWYRLRTSVSDSPHLVVSVTGMSLLLLYYLVVWIMVGRDPAGGTVYPRFKASDSMSPAALRYCWKLSYDRRSFGAAILNMAVKGYLTINEQASTGLPGPAYVLRRKKGGDLEALSRDERKLENAFFPPGEDTLDLSRFDDRRVWKAAISHREYLSREYNRIFFSINRKYWVPGLAILVLIFVAVGISSAVFLKAGGVLAVVTTSLILWLIFWWRLTIRSWRQRSNLLTGISLLIVLFSNIPLLVLIFLLVVKYFTSACTVPLTSFLVTIVVLTASVLLSLRFYRLLQAPTRLGRNIVDRIEGFRNYLVTTEERQLKKLYSEKILPDYFHPQLPYALALDINLPWLLRFSAALPVVFESEGIVMGPGAGDPNHGRSP